jgi:hypothetical protein
LDNEKISTQKYFYDSIVLMDNYFKGCSPMMDDGRLFTDYRSPQVREEIFKYKNCAISENEARTMRIENGEHIMDNDWAQIRNTKSCFPRKNCFHKQPSTKVTTDYNNAEILAYNGDLPAPPCDIGCHDYRLTRTRGSMAGRTDCTPTKKNGFDGYPANRCPNRCAKTNRLVPDGLYVLNGN